VGIDGGAWLSAQGYQQTRTELDRLLLSHRSDRGRLDDDDAGARHRWRERRIRHLQELLLGATVGTAPADDGIAEPGMVLTVRIDDDPETETFLLVPDGHTISITLLAARPYGHDGAVLDRTGAGEG
jgi:transcription elongation factor GreA